MERGDGTNMVVGLVCVLKWWILGSKMNDRLSRPSFFHVLEGPVISYLPHRGLGSNVIVKYFEKYRAAHKCHILLLLLLRNNGEEKKDVILNQYILKGRMGINEKETHKTP